MSDTTNRGRAAVWLLLSALVVLADQLSKSYITSHYGEFEFTTVLPILDITRMHNVIDRIRLGAVIDFIHFHWDRAYFPAFNIADSAITVGAACLILDAMLEPKRARAKV